MKLLRSSPQCQLKVERFGIPACPTTPKPTEEPSVALTAVVCDVPVGEPLGVVLDEALEILEVQANTVGATCFNVGDIVKQVRWTDRSRPLTLQVNGVVVEDVNHWHALIDVKATHFTFKVDRSKLRGAEVDRLPDDVERAITRHHGFKYLLVNVRYDDKRPFGMQMANCAHNKVIVTSVRPGSTAADFFKVGAHPSTPTSPSAAVRPHPRHQHPADDRRERGQGVHGGRRRQLPLRHRAAGQRRPRGRDPQDERRLAPAEDARAGSARGRAGRRRHAGVPGGPRPPLTPLQKYKARRAAGELVAAKAILRRPGRPSATAKHVQINPNPNLVAIVSDVPAGKALRRC